MVKPPLEFVEVGNDLIVLNYYMTVDYTLIRSQKNTCFASRPNYTIGLKPLVILRQVAQFLRKCEFGVFRFA